MPPRTTPREALPLIRCDVFSLDTATPENFSLAERAASAASELPGARAQHAAASGDGEALSTSSRQLVVRPRACWWPPRCSPRWASPPSPRCQLLLRAAGACFASCPLRGPGAPRAARRRGAGSHASRGRVEPHAGCRRRRRGLLLPAAPPSRRSHEAHGIKYRVLSVWVPGRAPVGWHRRRRHARGSEGESSCLSCVTS